MTRGRWSIRGEETSAAVMAKPDNAAMRNVQRNTERMAGDIREVRGALHRIETREEEVIEIPG